MSKNANIQTTEVKGCTSNVYVVDSTWKIDHFHLDKNYFVNLILPHDIECTLTLIPIEISSWKMVDSKKVNFKTVGQQAFIFINKIHHEEEKYKLKFQIKPVGRARRNMAFLPYQDIIVRAEGYKARGIFINYQNCKQIQDKDGAITLNLKFTLKELEHCKPFDREDYTIERTSLSKDLSKLFMSENFSDIDLILGDDKIRAHKIMLMAQSKAFQKMLANDTNITEIEINLRYPKEIYIDFFRFIYTNTIKNLKKYLDALISLAIEYEVEGLKLLCHLEVISIITEDFKKLTKCARPIPNHILVDFDKTQKFREMLFEMKMFMKKSSSPVSSPTEVIDVIKEIVTQEVIASSPVSSVTPSEVVDVIKEIETQEVQMEEAASPEVEEPLLENEVEEPLLENELETIIEEEAEVFTESMTNLITATLTLSDAPVANGKLTADQMKEEKMIEDENSECDADFESCIEEETEKASEVIELYVIPEQIEQIDEEVIREEMVEEVTREEKVEEVTREEKVEELVASTEI